MRLNQLPEGFKGEQKRQIEFDSPEAKLAYDAGELIKIAKAQFERTGVNINPIALARRVDDNIPALQAEIEKQQTAVGSAVEAVSAETVAPTEVQKRELTLEQAEATLRTLEARFQRNEYLHKGVKFGDVKKSLEANPESLWSVAQMETQGHEPDVYNSDKKGFDIGTCSKESPASARNCVYDKAAADWLRKNRPDQKFNGSAVEIAKAMGINLMDPNAYENILQKKGKFDLQTWSWLLTQSDIRSTGSALGGRRYDVRVFVFQRGAHDHFDRRAFRGSLRVSWKA